MNNLEYYRDVLGHGCCRAMSSKVDSVGRMLDKLLLQDWIGQVVTFVGAPCISKGPGFNLGSTLQD